VRFRRRPLRLLSSLSGVLLVTFIAYRVIPVNPTTVGFAYLLLILAIASTWGFLEAALSSILATLVFNFFFFPPVGTFTIADPQNWVALFSFLATSLIASRLSAKAKIRALEAVERRQDVERLYTFSRAILLIDRNAPFPLQLTEKLVEIFKLEGAALYERHRNESYWVGISSVGDIESQLRNGASSGVWSRPQPDRIVMGVSLGSEPVASMALQGAIMPDSVLQGIANLVAIGLERARAQDFAQQIEAARQSEQLRATLIDAMAHEFKTPLTLIKASTTSLLANPDQSPENRTEQLKTADEEAEHLRELIDDAVEMARLDTARIEVHPEISSLQETVQDVLASMQTETEDHPLEVECEQQLPAIAFDRRLMKLAIKQLLDNALKYSPAEQPVEIWMHGNNGVVTLEITDHGSGVATEEQKQIFERFYRSPSVKDQIPGSGLGLSIARSIVQAHEGEVGVSSRPGRTTFRISLPVVK
jgi:two-component system, OmpR family, sensor histidine kinase KdpD